MTENSDQISQPAGPLRFKRLRLRILPMALAAPVIGPGDACRRVLTIERNRRQPPVRCCRNDDGERARPEAASQQEETIVQFAGQFLGHHGVAEQDRKRAVRLTALGFEDAGDGPQVEGVGNQHVERIGGNGDHFAAQYRGGGSLKHVGLGLFGVDLNQVGCH